MLFPRNYKKRFPRPHYAYLLNIFDYLEYDIKYRTTDEFEITLQGKTFYIDFTDFKKLDVVGKPLFKFHYHGGLENVYPFPPISFRYWHRYKLLQGQIEYKATGQISSRQQKEYKIYHTKREEIQNLLKNSVKLVETNLLPNQISYWMDINNCLVAVFVPGATNNMLDRGQWQYMAFGCCTISPKLPELLPFNKILIPGVHYIHCNDDYSDLPEKIEWCKQNREKCIEIGRNAKKLFLETSTPEKIVEWIALKLGK